MTRLIEEGHQTKQRVFSREIIWYMLQFLKPNTRGERLYELRDLLEVHLNAHKVKCDVSQLEIFLLRWDTVITGVKKVPDEDTLHTLFYKQIKDIEILDFDIKSYDRLPEPERKVEMLRKFCDRAIEVQRSEDNQRQRHRDTQKLIKAAGAGARVSSFGRSRSSARGNSSHRSSSRGSNGHRHRSTSRGRDKFKKDKRKKTLSRDKLCRDFEKNRCTRGAGCNYSHSKDGKRQSSRDSRRGSSGGRVAAAASSSSRSGRARAPPRQRTASPPVIKSKHPCNLFAAGKCHFGANCRFQNVNSAAPSPLQSPEKARRGGSDARRSDNSPAPGGE